jgi:hypothetical protein
MKREKGKVKKAAKLKEEEKVKKAEEKREEREAGTCIICQKETVGIPVKDDFVIRGIRRIKSALKIARGTKLIVCSEHLEEATKRRERFEKTLLTYGGIGAAIGILLIIASLIGGRDLLSILSSLLLAVLLIVVFVILSLAYYFPAMERKVEKEKK